MTRSTMARCGFPATVAVKPVARSTAATIAPAPGHCPSVGVGGIVVRGDQRRTGPHRQHRITQPLVGERPIEPDNHHLGRLPLGRDLDPAALQPLHDAITAKDGRGLCRRGSPPPYRSGDLVLARLVSGDSMDAVGNVRRPATSCW